MLQYIGTKYGYGYILSMQKHLKSIHFVKQCKEYSVPKHRKGKYFKFYTVVDWHFHVCYNHLIFTNRLTTTTGAYILSLSIIQDIVSFFKLRRHYTG